MESDLSNKVKTNLCLQSALSPVVPPLSTSHNITIAKIDSGASGHYCREEDKSALKNVQQSLGPVVTLPDQTSMQTNEKGLLNFPLLTKQANMVPE